MPSIHWGRTIYITSGQVDRTG